jgi:subtilisin family serine protease
VRKVWVLGVALSLVASVFATSVSAAEGRSRKLTVVFQNGALPANVAGLVQQAGGRLVSAVPEVGMVQVEGTPATMQALQRVAGVQAVAPSLRWQLQVLQQHPLAESAAAALSGPGDMYAKYQWDIKQVTRDGASWNLDKGSHQTVVGIVDTGVDSTHRDLAANFMGGRNFVPAGENGDPTETGDPADYTDRLGHGSHVAGDIAGNGRIYGVGPNLGFRAYRVFGASGGSDTATITAAMISAANDGVDVISMSLGGYDVLGKVTWTDPDTSTVYDLGDDHADLIAYVRAVKYATQKGSVVVAAAGNEAIDAGNPKAVTDYMNQTYGPLGYTFQGAGIEVPSGIPGAVGVTATGPNAAFASYSNYGRGFADVTAPGGDFQRYGQDADWYLDLNLSADNHGGYVFMAGTSMATPKVSAVAALYIDQYKATHGGARPSPMQTAQVVLRSANDIGSTGYDQYFGFGMVDAYRVLGGR